MFSQKLPPQTGGLRVLSLAKIRFRLLAAATEIREDSAMFFKHLVKLE